MTDKPFFEIQPADPFQLFLAKVAGQHIVLEDEGNRLEAYVYKGITYVTAFIPAQPVISPGSSGQ